MRVASASSPSPEIGLGGTLRLPLGSGPFPAVVLLADAGTTSGSVGSQSLLSSLADHLLRQGVAVLRLDERGTGRSAAIPSAKAATELAADAQSALTYLRSHRGINPLRVGVLGHGEGANVALLAAAQAPTPAFLVALGAAGLNGQELLARQTSLVNQAGEPDTAQRAWNTHYAQRMAAARREAKTQLAAGVAPAQVQVRVAQEQLRLNSEVKKRSDALFKRQFAMLEIIRQTPDNGQAQAIVANMLKQLYPALSTAAAQVRAGQLTSPWYRSLLAFDPQTTLANIACPALLLHATADTQVAAATNAAVLEKGFKGNKQVDFQRLDGVNHDFQAVSEQALAAGTTPSADAVEAVGEWITQRVR